MNPRRGPRLGRESLGLHHKASGLHQYRFIDLYNRSGAGASGPDRHRGLGHGERREAGIWRGWSCHEVANVARVAGA